MTRLRLPYYDLSPDALNALRSVKSASGTLDQCLLEWVYLRISQINGGLPEAELRETGKARRVPGSG